jgi:histidinol phosphatase-like PHP family hydrolase
VHPLFRQSKDIMIGRILDALANPHVFVLARLSGRLLGARERVELEFERGVDAARKNQVELDA